MSMTVTYLMRVAMSMTVAVTYESGDEYDSCSIS